MDIKGFLKAKAKPLSVNTLRNYENSLDLLNRTIDGEEPTVDEIIEWLNTFDSAPTLSRHKSAIYRYGLAFSWHAACFPAGYFRPCQRRADESYHG